MAVVSRSVQTVHQVIREKGAVVLSASQQPATGTVRKLLNGTTEFAKTGDVRTEPPEIQA